MHVVSRIHSTFIVLSPDGLPEFIFAIKLNGLISSHVYVAPGFIVADYIPIVCVANICLEQE
jgi:hypothetical protein